MNKILWWSVLCTLGPIGYLPAPGTMGTLIAFPLVLLFRFYVPVECIYILLSGLVTFVSYIAISKYMQNFPSEKDPSEIVLDEVVGVFFTLYGLPVHFHTVIFAFLLFRFFDIVKPFGLKRIEKTDGATGIILDDIGAAVLTNVIIRMVLLYMR